MHALALLLSCSLVSAFPGGNHHGDGHESNCVDISVYGDLQYNETVADVCTYKKIRHCETRNNQACASIPLTTCSASANAACVNTPFSQTVREDSTEQLSFVGKECFESGSETLIEYQQKPVCTTVTKEQCDSKWVVNEFGEKVWAGNENCKDVTWEDCKLESIPHPIVVPTYTCQDKAVIQYTKPTFSEIDVTAYTAKCQAAAFADCSTNYVQECVELEYEECTDSFEEVCFGAMTFRIPFQEYDHRLKCIQ